MSKCHNGMAVSQKGMALSHSRMAKCHNGMIVSQSEMVLNHSGVILGQNALKPKAAPGVAILILGLRESQG